MRVPERGALEPSQLQLFGLLSQAEKQQKIDKVWSKRSEHFLTWPEAQVARLKAVAQ